jgi:beta-glucanase (GH16 family)
VVRRSVALAVALTLGSAGTRAGDLSLSGYCLTFDDEFNELSASPSGQGTKWASAPDGGDRSSGGQGYVLDPSVGGKGETPFSVSGGILDITTKATSLALSEAVNQPYTTGYLDTHVSFSQQYGYFEMRAKLPGVIGSSSAFWLVPAGQWPPEIDIQEVGGDDPRHLQMTNHYGATGVDSKDDYNAPDLSADYHIYGLMWTPSTITWYLDGVKRFSAPTRPDENQKMFVIVSSYAHVNSYMPSPKDPASFKAHYYIDWVHVYSNNPKASKIAGQPGYQDHDGSCSIGGPAQTKPHAGVHATGSTK